MLFLVISSPHPTRPEEVKDARLEFRSWVAELDSQNKLVCFYPRVGRGSVVILDVTSNDELHRLLTQWLNIVPVGFEVHPLVTPTEARELLE
jgi:muconolactone delta-isomerase